VARRPAANRVSAPGGRFRPAASGNRESMLRKILWSGLYAALGAAATMAARRAASSIWRIATGEQPPTKK
jgi:hypothetical protein